MSQISGIIYEHELIALKKFNDTLSDLCHQAIADAVHEACPPTEEDALYNSILSVIIDIELLTRNIEKRSERIRFEDFPGTLENCFQKMSELNGVKNFCSL